MSVPEMGVVVDPKIVQLIREYQATAGELERLLAEADRHQAVADAAEEIHARARKALCAGIEGHPILDARGRLVDHRSFLFEGGSTASKASRSGAPTASPGAGMTSGSNSPPSSKPDLFPAARRRRRDPPSFRLIVRRTSR
jgi:hypothetical protein